MSRETSRGTAKVRHLCQTFGISRQAYYAARKPRPACLATQKTRQRRERRGPWATATELEAGIREVVGKHPAWGTRKVWARLRKNGMIVSRNRVWAMMRVLGLVLPPVKEREPTAPRGQVAVDTSNRRWASDLTTAWTRRDGWAAIVPVIDCGDRYALACGVMKSQQAPMVLAPLEQALVAEFGEPANVPWEMELRSDHGTQYTGKDCENLCDHWGVVHTFAPVGRPTGNAVVERFIQTMKIELIWTRDWESIAELRAAIDTWLASYNHERPHQALGWDTPAERRAGNLGIQVAA